MRSQGFNKPTIVSQSRYGWYRQSRLESKWGNSIYP